MPKKNPPSTGRLVDAMFEIRAEITELNAQIKELNRKKSMLQEMILERFDEQDLKRAEGTLGSISIKTAINPRIEDWDKVERYVLRKKDFSLLQRRLSSTRYRELLEESPKRGVPGLSPVEVRSLNFSATK